MDNSGHAIVVWGKFNGSNFIVQERHSSDYGASWSATPATATNLSENGENAYIDQIVMDNSGNAILIYFLNLSSSGNFTANLIPAISVK